MSEDDSMIGTVFAHQRIHALENTVNQSQQVMNETNVRLDRLTQVVEQLINVHSSASPTPEARTPTVPPAPQRTSNRVKVAPPSDFSGDRQLGRAFLNNCKLYLELNSESFADDKQRIHWALSYFKTGRAAKFADRLLRAEPGKGLQLTTWKDFEKEFTQRFCETNERVHALTKLEGSSWHQRGSPVDDYIDAFEELIDLAGLETDAGLVMKFRRGLSNNIQDKIAEMQDAPALDDLASWKSASRRIYQNLEANRAFVNSHRTSSNQATNRLLLPSRPPGVRLFPVSNPAPLVQPARPTEPSVTTIPTRTEAPTPMEVDAAKQRRALPLICFRCRQPGHRASECPRRFDVRALVESLEAEEKQELLEQLLVEADLTEVAAREEENEDFVKGGE